MVCQYANFVHREGGGLTQMHLSTAENIDRMRESYLYSWCLAVRCALFGMYFLLFAVFQGEIKYDFSSRLSARCSACATRISMCCICCLQITTGRSHIGFWC